MTQSQPLLETRSTSRLDAPSPARPDEEAPARTRNARWILLVSAFAMVPLLPTLRAAFVYDDAAIIRDNPLLRGWGSLLRVWSAEYWPIGGSGLYRPVHLALLSVVWNVGGGRAVWFHAYALLLAALTALAVWWLARRTVAAGAAAVGALWFATQPLHVEATASAANSSELLVVLCTLALVAVLRRGWSAGNAEHSARGEQVLAVGLLVALALLSKESGVMTLPLAAVTAWGWRRHVESRRTFFRDRQWGWVAGAVAIACVLLARRAVLGGGGAHVGVVAPGLGGLTWYGRCTLVTSLWIKSVAMMAWPTSLSPYYGPTVLPAARALFALVGLGVGARMAYVVVRFARSGDARPLVASSWIVLTWLPASNLAAPTGPLLADRTLFGATVGVALALAWVLDRLGGRTRTVALAVCLVVTMRNALETAEYARDWTSHRLLWSRLVRNVPGEQLGYRLLGMDARARGDTTESLMLLEHAHSLAPTDANTMFELGQTLYARGRYDEAERVLAPLMSKGDAQARRELVAMYLDAVGRARGAPAVVLAATPLLGTRADAVASEYMRAARAREGQLHSVLQATGNPVLRAP